MYKHMNACALKPNKWHIKQNPRYKIQEKFKGIRAFMFITPEGSYLQTRGGFFVEHNFQHLSRVKCYEDKYVLDGELWQEGVEDEVIAGWANSKYLSDDTSGVQFQCFDIVHVPVKGFVGDLSLEARDVFRRAALDMCPTPNLLYVPYLEGDPDERFAGIVSRGGEGLMYKNLDSPYSQRDGDNRPANHWYKEKGVEDHDVVVMGYKEAKPGKFEGMIGSVLYGKWFEGKLLPLGYCSGMTDEVRNFITLNADKLLGKVFEVRAAGQDLNSLALIEPRFIRWRDDKRPDQCLLVEES